MSVCVLPLCVCGTVEGVSYSLDIYEYYLSGGSGCVGLGGTRRVFETARSLLSPERKERRVPPPRTPASYLAYPRVDEGTETRQDVKTNPQGRVSGGPGKDGILYSSETSSRYQMGDKYPIIGSFITSEHICFE